MIDRYTRAEMGRLWSEERKFAVWLEIELLASEKMAQLGLIPKGAPARMRRRARFDVRNILKIEERTRHDVIAFLTDVGRHLGEDEKYLHLGMTSSDVLDTALSVRMVEAGNMILAGLRPVMRHCARLAKRYIDVPMAGRTHGVFAEPTSVGLKFALWYADLTRARRRIKSATHSVAVGKLSGAVGTFAHLDPRVERYVCRRLKLRPAPISTQVVQRDRHAEYVFAMAALATEAEKIAQEIRLLHRTETGEITEGFFAGQRGSSAMPHKKNPIVCERVCGLARLLRGFVTTSLENVALWHERDISHSSVERVVIPDTTILTDYILHLLDELLANIGVHKDRARANLERWGGSVFSQRLLLVLADKLGSRDKAYVAVQKLAQESSPDSSFEETVRGNAMVRQHLSDDEISDVFDWSHFLRHARSIMRRALEMK